VIATFASYVGVYGLIKIAMGNPKPVKAVKPVGRKTDANGEERSRRRGATESERSGSRGRGAAEAADASAARPVGADSAFVGSRRASHSPSSLRHARLHWTPFDASDADSRSRHRDSATTSARSIVHRCPILFALFFFFLCRRCFSAVVAVTPVASASGYQEPTAENIGQWLENPANIAAWEKSLA
jgi:hypothetical protein